MTSVFPSILKTAKVVPVFKKDSKLNYSSYCPIPLYQILKKYLKNLCIRDCIPSLITIILSMTYSLDLDNNILHLMRIYIYITENIRKALDDGNLGCGIFVDLQKAFCTVDHQILLAKLNHYGILRVSNDWFKFYLFNRS